MRKHALIPLVFGLLSMLTACPLTSHSVFPSLTLSLNAATGSVAAGSQVSVNATLTPKYGFTDTVSLALVSAPAGITLNGGPFAINGSDPTNSTLFLVVAPTVTAGTYPLTVRASSSSTSVSATYTLTVTPTASSFNMVLNPSAGSAAAGTQTITTATLLPKDGFTGSVSLSLVSPPAGISLSGGPVTINSSSATNVPLTISVASTVATGSYTLDVQATSGFTGATVPYSLTVTLAPGSQLFAKQFGSSGVDQISSVAAAPDGGFYVGGFTTGTLPNATSAGGWDAFVAKYSSSGNLVFVTQFGTTGDDQVKGIAVGPDGSVYAGGNNGGGFLAKFTPGLTQIWFKALSPVESQARNVNSVVVDSDNRVYVGGSISGTKTICFVAEFDSDGKENFVLRLGTSKDASIRGISVAADGSIYVAGDTNGAFPGFVNAGGYDAFLAKMRSGGGGGVWIRQFGTSGTDGILGVSVAQDGSVYVGGATEGTFAGIGRYDGFVAKYDSSGNRTWLKQLGTAGIDQVNGVSVAPDGVYVAGYTTGSFPGITSAGGYDGFVAKYDASGNQTWLKQLGTEKSEDFWAVATARDGSVIAGGDTSGTLPGFANAGKSDAIVAQFSP